jgi:hypothetical protein
MTLIEKQRPRQATVPGQRERGCRRAQATTRMELVIAGSNPATHSILLQRSLLDHPSDKSKGR